MFRWRIAVLSLTFLCTLPLEPVFASDTAPQPLSILHITPDGMDVPAGRQIVISFSRPVVPIGRMERKAEELPITIKPAIPCEWRWLNTTALSCNLPEKNSLAPATRYRIEVKPGIKTEDGATIPETYKSEFTTIRPAIAAKQFHLWETPGHPVVRLVFNQPVSQTSVEQHVYLLAVGARQRVFREESDAHIHLRATPDLDDRELPSFLPLPGEKYLAYLTHTSQKPDSETHIVGVREARRVWLVEPDIDLPPDTHIIVQAEDGLASAFGPVKGVADKDIVEFDTFPEFAFLGIRCTSITGQPLQFLTSEGKQQEQETPQKPAHASWRFWQHHNFLQPAASGAPETGQCDPLAPVNLVFNAPVEQGALMKALRFTPSIKGWEKDQEPEVEPDASEPAYQRVSWQLRNPHEKGQTYEVWLPAGLKAAQPYHMESLRVSMGEMAQFWHYVKAFFRARAPIEVTDMFGRKLGEPVNISFSTDHRRPNFILEHHDAVLEKSVDSDVPVFVDNIAQLIFHYRKITAGISAANLTLKQKVAAVQDIQFAMPFGIREALNGRSGAIYGFMDTDPPTPGWEGSKRIFAQVTPFQVHMKLGHFSSLAWITDLATGQPVKEAKVTLYQDALNTLGAPKDIDASAITDAAGVAVLPGTATVDPDLTKSPDYVEDEKPRMLLRVDKGEDMALMPLSSAFIINSYRSSGTDYICPAVRHLYGHMKSWGMTAQGIYRAGDTMQYKIYVRNQDNDHFVPPPLHGYTLRIFDAMGKKASERNHITLSPFGSFSGEYTIPKNASVGWYSFRLSANFTDTKEEEADSNTDENNEDSDETSATAHWTPMRVLVSDFTPAPFKVSGQLNGDHFSAGQQITSSTHAELHSGGPYTQASTRVTAILQSEPFTSKNPLAQGFQFDSFEGEQDSQQVFQKIAPLDTKGELQESFSVGDPHIVYGSLNVESAVQDDRGKYISASTHADYTGVDRLVGLRSTEWLYQTGKPARVQYIVVDDHGVPAKGTAAHITVEHEESKAARVKSAGNAYLTEYHNSWEQVAECQGTSASAAEDCIFTPKAAGSYRVSATIKDTKGHDHRTQISGYALGHDFVVWGDESDNALTIIPEKTGYKIGDTARFMIKNPYPNAEALITVERYGILDHFVRKLEGNTPVISIPVKPDYLPGFYLSVTIMSPRVEKPLNGQVDLGKPTYRMGYLRMPVTDPYKQVTITAKTDKQVYKPRDHVDVTLHAGLRHDNGQPIEIAAVVLDASVFDLIAKGKAAFDPYTGFYSLENIDLRNYSLLQRLIGRQKFEKKGANPGGDGGNAHETSMRSLFKFVSYWNPSILPDKDGNAHFSFEAPDNLTGWRVLLLGATPDDRFGLGETDFKVNRPTEIRPVMPNQITEGDQFNAGFSVMNRTAKPRTLEVKVKVTGDTAQTAPFTKTVTIAPYQRTTVFLPVKAATLPLSRHVHEGHIAFSATAEDETDSDGLTHNIPVHKQRSLEFAANYATTTKAHALESIQFPAGILPDVGNISVVVSPSVIGNIVGAFQYLHDYPYMCWEQQLTKGVMAAHYKQLKAYLPTSFTWPDSSSLPQTTLDNASSFQAPNGGMSYFTPLDTYADPYLSAYTAIAFTWLRRDGYHVPQEVESKLADYLSDLLRNNSVPDFYSEGMSSTVRAVALAALAENDTLEQGSIERYRSFVPKMSLFGKANFLEAALKAGAKQEIVDDVVRQILATSNETGGKFIFSETLDDGYVRILASPLRDNCAVLESLMRYAATAKGKQQLGDVPFKLVRTITQTRGNRDHWENTQENLFCMNALVDYSHIYESTPPAMQVTASMDGKAFGKTAFHDVRDTSVTLMKPITNSDPGRKAEVEIHKSGDGRLYYSTQLSYALPPSQTHEENAGIEIHREYSVERDGKWKMLKSPASLKRGELVRVDLYVSVPTARNFVVVDDPVPGGLETVNSDLATASKVDAKKGAFEAAGGSWWFHFSDWMEYGVSRWSFYHKELRDNAARFYSDYLPAGNYHLSYSAQAIATGDFAVMPAMAQEMYDPDVYGKTQAATLHIGEQ
ncbi:MAG TPA: MG2 domain-containing protein [Rickettsiales bacterium]|nr:MG2 domain-containing protein [Rickettsiales bacterium]